MSSQASFTFIVTVIQTATVGIGLIGNLLSIIIFSRKTFRNNSISTYCIALSIVNCITLAQFISLVYNLAFNVNLANESDSLCKFFNSMPAFLSGFQPWIMVVFSLDKLLCMRANSKPILKKKWFKWSVVVGIILINTAIYIHMPILMRRREIFPGFLMCDLSTIPNFKVSVIVNLVESGFISFIIMVFTSVITTRMLIKSRNAVMKTTGQVSKERKSRDRKYAISSLSFNILFIVFKLPGLVFFTMNAFFGYFDMYFLMLATLSFGLNSTFCFFIHLATNSLFRRELLVLFGLAKRNSGSTLSHTISRTNHTIRLNQVSAAL